ncbi:MAG TPA: hypothetical protein VNX26_16315 [Candidatus Acidoferrum sp.]|nr:hypothetical protein [Candidatus Acidoferrum sp.]
MDFDEAIVRGEGFAMDLEAVASEEQVARDELAGVVSGERAVELEGVAGEIDRGFDREAVGADNFEAKFSGIALGVDNKSQERESEEQDAEVEQ